MAIGARTSVIMKRLFLIDAYSLLYRAHFAFVKSPLINSKGMHTSALFGFFNMIFGLQEREEPEYMAVAFDASEKTFRNDLFPEYKGTRQKTPDELVAQFPYARDIIRAMNLPVVESARFEADDLLGSMARHFASDDLQVVIVTGDKDSLQLVNDNVRVMMTKKGITETLIYDPSTVKELHGITPDQVVDMKALMGDSSDNIPGVPGVGEKTAVKLITEYSDLDGVFANLDSIKGKLKEKLTDNRDQAYLSQDLARIRTDVPFDVKLENCQPGNPDRDRMRHLFVELEMRRLMRLIEPDTVTESEEERSYETVLSRGQFDALLARIKTADTVALDTETTSTEPTRAALVGISISVKKGEAFYIPLAHQYLGAPEQLPLQDVLKDLKEVLDGGGEPLLVGQNLKYDLIVLERHGLSGLKAGFDTMVASYVLEPTRMRHSMDALALELLNIKTIPYSDVVPKDRTFDQIEVDRATEYAAEDADITLRLFQVLKPRLVDGGLMELFTNLEMPLLPVLARMEMNGISIDPDYLGEFSKELTTEIRHLEQKIHGQAGEEFNINSPQQLAVILFDKLRLPVIRKTKTGRSTDAAVLEELEKAHGSEMAAMINHYRHLVKLRGTYVDALPRLLNPETKRIHTSFSQVTAATGRLSSSDPNLQNIPIRTEVGNRIRKAFRPDPPDWVFIGADYSQIELRVMAHVTGSPVLREAFERGDDIHTETAALIFGIPVEQVDSTMRNRAKSINFGILYGMGPFGLARRLGITQAEAKTFIASYFERLPEVKRFIDETIVSARKNGYVTTLMNRRRALPEINAKSANQRAFAERIAINTPIQGTAADLIKIAMIRLDEELRSRSFQARLLLQIHDELVLETPTDQADEVAACMKTVMEGAMELSVPLVANLARGSDWSELK